MAFEVEGRGSLFLLAQADLRGVSCSLDHTFRPRRPLSLGVRQNSVSHIPDLGKVGDWIAIGWLHPDHPYSQGSVSPEFASRLREFALLWFKSVEALGWPVSAGVHLCEFCGKVTGTSMFGVLSHGHLYYVPDMVAHYVDEHGYAPPISFVQALMACPLPGTREYAALVTASPFA